MSQSDKDTIAAEPETPINKALRIEVMNNATNRRVGKLAEYGLTPAVRYETGVLLWTAEETDKLLALLRKLPEE